MNHIRILDLGHLPAATNMALDRIILEEVADCLSPPTLRFLQFQPAAALVGYHQDVDLEIRSDYCREQGIDINRRLTGGGSIFFQESALGWELFARFEDEPFTGSYESLLSRICNAAAAGFSRLGVDARFRPRNDIEVHGRKISGTGGVAISGAFMFQGTLLVENEVQAFIKALRVPVEKLKKREIESLMQRVCFLSDLLSPTPSTAAIKEAMIEEFRERFGIQLLAGPLTDREQQRLSREQEFFAGAGWIRSRSRPEHEGEPLRAIGQTANGTLRIHLWQAPGGRTIRQVLIAGDFFAYPDRLSQDLEAFLVGARMEKEPLEQRVHDFFAGYEGRIIGITPDEVARAVSAACERRALIHLGFSLTESNELFLVNVSPEDLGLHVPRWLLLPYCSKNLDCSWRFTPGCSECGACEIGECCELARSYGMEPVTIQSFEHLMETLATECEHHEGLYIGSCCEAFYAKHQQEMEAIHARGVLINLDSTTCYDLGKGTEAYKGHFDNKTFLNMELVRKLLACIHDAALGMGSARDRRGARRIERCG